MTKQLASIYYVDQPPIVRPSYMGHFKLQPVKRGEPPFLLTIKDHTEVNTLPWSQSTRKNRQTQQRVTIFGQDIASDVLLHLAGMHPAAAPDCHPGIWIVRDTIALVDEKGNPSQDADGMQETRPATREERDAMFAEDLATATEHQANWGQRAIDLGNRMAEDPKKIEWIPSYCRESAAYYGHSPAWLKRTSGLDVQVCHFCKTAIPATAAKCPNCDEILDHRKYAELKEANKRLGQERPAQSAA